MRLFDGDEFTHAGHQFRVRFEHDDCHGAPWEECDGHGIIREGYESEKRPGWRKMAQTGGRGAWKFYDIQETMKLAKRDGWDAPPYKTGTAGERAARAVEADFQFLRAWCEQEWEYVVVIVTMLDKGGNETKYSDVLGGVESFGNYHEEMALEMAGELALRFRADRRAEQKEKRERNYWQSRDVLTV